MTSDELKKLLDDHKVIRSTLNSPCSDCYIQGYEEAVKLLWPLVEALEFYKNYADCKTMNIKCACKFCVGDDKHRNVFKDLEQKLKGG